jgi:hypothetical protein
MDYSKDYYRRLNNTDTLAYIPPDSPHELACRRVPLLSVWHLLGAKAKWLDQLRGDPPWQDKMAPNACCHDPKNLDIDAWYTTPEWKEANGVPDLYKLYCRQCLSCHGKLCVDGEIYAKHQDGSRVRSNRKTHPHLYEPNPVWNII